MRPRHPSLRPTSSARRGVSLIEALVAMAVMAFGMLGLAGLQASLRGNSDQARQRSEAVRIAQANLENLRSFSVLNATAGRRSFDQIVSSAAADATPLGSNANFTLQTLVTDPDPLNALSVAWHKRVVVDVSWADRNNLAQNVRFGTIVSATSPEIAGAMAAPADASPVQQTSGRNIAIPTGAVDQGDGTSKFAPPGAPGGFTWTFNNVTGFITQICLGAICVDYNARLLSGYVNFATGASQPTPAEAEIPPSNRLVNGAGATVSVTVTLTAPVAGALGCYHLVAVNNVAYYCAIPVSAPSLYWSGKANVNLPAGLDLADAIDDDHDDRYRVCRYTVAAARVLPHPAVPPLRNEDHPLNYSTVKGSLTNQNFLVIRAGDDHDPFTCPADDATSPYVNGNTWHHQPSE